MTEAKHTPGPWDDSKTIIVRGLNFLASAHFETAEGEANARLIAAAPDLLDALKHARNQIQHPDQMIDEAISKAEGRQ